MNRNKLIDLVRYWMVIAIGVVLAAHFVRGIIYDNNTTLLIVVLLLSVFNTFLKPILLIITLPFIILTFGLMVWIINAFLFMLASWFVDGFYVESFSSAMWGSLIVSLVAIAANALFGKPGKRRPAVPDNDPDYNEDPTYNEELRHKSKKDDVIDI